MQLRLVRGFNCVGSGELKFLVLFFRILPMSGLFTVSLSEPLGKSINKSNEWRNK